MEVILGGWSEGTRSSGEETQVDEGGRHIDRSGRPLALAPVAQAASCNTSGGGATLNITIASGQSVNVRINNANTILVDGGGLTDDNCGGNNAGTVTTIDVDGAGGNETLTINNTGGGGAFDDDDDFNVDLPEEATR